MASWHWQNSWRVPWIELGRLAMDSYQKPITIILMFFMDLKEKLQETPIGFDGKIQNFRWRFSVKSGGAPAESCWVMFMGHIGGMGLDFRKLKNFHVPCLVSRIPGVIHIYIYIYTYIRSRLYIIYIYAYCRYIFVLSIISIYIYIYLFGTHIYIYIYNLFIVCILSAYIFVYMHSVVCIWLFLLTPLGP